MRLTVLGSGSSVPHPSRTSSAYWLGTEKGSLMLDCAPSALFRAAQEKLDWPNLDAIWISHFHLDHFGGLPPMLFSMKYAPQTQFRKKPLRIFGPRGLTNLLERINDSNSYRLFDQPFPLEIIEVEPFEDFYPIDGIKAVTLKTPHTEESMAITLIDSSENKITFTSDTGFSTAISAFAYSADLFILECSFVKSKPTNSHLEISEAMHLIRHAKPQKAMLTHFYPEWDSVNFDEIVEEFSPNCALIEAKDGLHIEIV